MVRLTMDLIIRGTSGYAKKKRDESSQHFIKRLTHLYLEDRNIEEVSDDLTLCRNLMVLYIYDNKLTKIPNLNGNGNLTHLYMQNNQITKMEGLNALQKLTKLYLGGNCISVLEGMDKLSFLQELHMENQKLPTGEKLLFDPRTLIALSRSLQMFDVSGNGIDSIYDLQCLQLLTQFTANDNLLSNMKELAVVLGSWPHLWRIDLAGNPLSHKAKYRDRIIIMAPSLEMMDGKEITDTAKKFLQNWQASREAAKRKHELGHQNGSSYAHIAATGNGIERRLTGAAKCLGNDVPGYIMPALPRKQFQEVLARSTSHPNSGQSNHKSYSEISSHPRYLDTSSVAYQDSTESETISTQSSAIPGHKLSVIKMGSDFAHGDNTEPS
ncbi:hypothetical protein LSH36_68g15015 [Paralvinella palmiformis]|uniref:Protein phosphatase 1 regulatory subunit 42 n=1 Tax=Paralvinella palmiformis TaxID=53620 RepID=A0AAD9K3N4_9ANNE|nr:hypothetical protein LSH36_68g15015 [Paralvinella palmiformis]